MLGAIIGDIAGSRFEFNPTNDYNFEIFAPGSDFTDDTICTVAIMDAILRDEDFGKTIHEWCRRYPDPMGGYGGRFEQWVCSLEPKPYNSFGNGAAMRVSPVAWAKLNAFGMLPMAAKSAECTHNHPEGIKGAQTVALAIHKAIELNNCFPQFGKEQMKALMDECLRFSGYNINLRKEDVQNKFDETCQGTVPVALWTITQSNSFEDAVRRAVSLGADADTLGAIVGSIAEAIWGIPEDMMMDALDYLPDEMKTVVLRFYSRYVPNSILRGYGDESAAEDILKEEELREKEQQNPNSTPMKEFQAIMLWKLGLGHMGRFFNGENPLPDKERLATEHSWKIETMPEKDVSKLLTDINLSDKDMRIIRRGHIPEAQEDHWFMYCDKEFIRYYRSWTGMCAYEAHYTRKDDHWHIDRLTVNHALGEFGVNGDEPSEYLFVYLLTAETGADATQQWDAYLKKWEETYFKYANQSKQETQTESIESNDDKDDVTLDDIYEEREIIEPSFSPTQEKRTTTKIKRQQDIWYVGYENHVCEVCIYANGIRRWADDPYSGIMGCGRLGYNSFRQRYTSGECEYKKIDLFIPSAFEKMRKEEALEKKRREEEERLRLYRKEQRLLKLDKQDGTYERKLIRDFIGQKLDGDIDRIIDFDFNTLKDDQIFGDSKGFAFSVDKCNIVQAIMSVTFGDLWPGLNLASIEDYTYNVTHVNHMHYLFGANILDQYFKGMQNFHPTEEQHKRAVKVSHLLDTIGNLWILPKSIDTDKDTYHYHGYTDLFLKAVYNVMTGKGKVDPSLKGTLYNARKQMGHLQGSEGFDKMARGLFLDDYLDYYGKPTDVLPQIWCLMKFIKRDVYFKAVDDYCTFMESFVHKRSKLIVKKLKKALGQENLAMKYHIEQMLEEEQQNEFSKVGYAFLKAINKLVEDKRNEDKSYLFKTLDAMSLEKGYALGLKLPTNVGMGDESSFYTYPIDKEKKENNLDDMSEPLTLSKDDTFNHIKVNRNAMGIWQAYLYDIAPTVLPTFWHGGYIRRTYIFSHKDLETIHALYPHEKAPLYGIKDMVSPKVKMRGTEGTIECCYWSEWQGLVCETLKVTYANESIISIKRIKEEVLYEYNCGICF